MLSTQSELFTEIYEEQQEVVAGGNIAAFLATVAAVDYNAVTTGGVAGANNGFTAIGNNSFALDFRA